jgi:prenyltransferase beta subunit/protocatechuate 3,4-dioxygenase beta subunit
MSKRIMSLLIILSVIIFCPVANATPEITNGLSYLISTQNPDGSWGSDITDSEILPSTVSVIETLQRLNQTNTSNYSNAIIWLQLQGLETTDYLSERIHALSVSGTDQVLLISYVDDMTGAWSGDDSPDVDNLDTVLALSALNKINYSNQNTIDYALNYLIANQNADGGWGLKAGMDSEVYYTALVSSILQQFPQTTSIATAINKATTYLIAHQNTDGGFATSTGSGQGESTVYETAYVYLALIGETTDATVLGNAINYLASTQLPNGSWDDDPYSTALALRALHVAVNPPPQPITGTVTGKVVDVSTNQPLGGVSVVSGQLSATTTNTGEFTLSDMPSGSQTITLSLNGYATASVTVNITAGSITDLGTITLSTSPTTGIIKGTVTDASNGQPLEGVAITVTGSFSGSTTTGTDGSFIFTDVTPGNVTMTASKTGYYSATGTGTVTAGGILFFNPQLNTQPPPATTGNLTGKVFDSSTNTPIQGAIVSLSGGPSTSTDAQGMFLINDITPNTYQVTISATGYTSQNYQLMITAGVTTDMQTIYLTPVSQSTTVTGRVTDTQTGNPISNADVIVIGTSFSTKTDAAGAYTLSGIDLLDFALRASATGYDSEILNVTLTTYGIYTVDFALNPSQPSELRIISLTTDKQNYAASEDVLISATIENQGSTEIQGLVVAEIQDIEGGVKALVTPSDPDIAFALLSSTQTTIQWNTDQFSPGDYSIILKVIDPATVSYTNPTGNILAEMAASISITSSPALGGAIPYPTRDTGKHAGTYSYHSSLKKYGQYPHNHNLKARSHI